MTYEEYKKKKKEEQSGNVSSGSQASSAAMSYDEYYKANNSGKAAQDIYNRVNEWLNSTNSYITSHNERYKNGNTAYRTDANDWYKQSVSNYQNTVSGANSIRSDLEKWGDYLNKDWVNSVNEALEGNLSAVMSIGGAAKDDLDFWSSFEDEDQYNAWKWTDDYKDYSLEDLQKEIGTTTDEKKLDFLKAYSLEKDYGTSAEYDKGVKYADDQIAERQKELNTINTRISGYSRGNLQYTDSYKNDVKRKKELESEITSLQKNKDALSAKGRIKKRSEKAERYELNRGDNSFESVAARGAQIENPSYEDVMNHNMVDVYHLSEEEKQEYYNVDLHINNKLEFFFENKDKVGFESALGLSGNGYIAPDIIATGFAANWELIEPKEREMYNYLLEKEGEAAAEEYFDDLQYVLNERAYKIESESWQKAYADANALEKVLMNAATVPANLLGNVTSFISDSANMLSGRDIDRYDGMHSLGNFARETRTMTSEEIGEEISNPFLRGLATNAYQGVMSGLDSVAGAATLGNGYTLVMGMGAASQKAGELYERGASKGQIAMGATLSGLIEYATEKVSIDRLLADKDVSSWGKVFKEILVQGGVEASEEFSSELLNHVAESIIQGGNSVNENAIRQLMLTGMSEEEATRKVVASNAVDAFWAAYAGFISGSGMSTGSYAAGIGNSAFQQMKEKSETDFYTGKHIHENKSVGELVSIAESLDNTKSSAKIKALAKSISEMDVSKMNDAQKKKYQRNVGKLKRIIVQEQGKSYSNAGYDTSKSVVVEKLKANGVAEADIDKAAEVIIKATLEGGYGKNLTNSEKALFDKVGGKEIQNGLLKNREQLGEEVSKKQQEMIGQLLHTESLSVDKTKIDTSKYNKSRDGKVYVVENGETKEVEITGVNSVKNGKVMLNLSNGKTVDALDLEISSDDAMIFVGLSQMGVDAHSANAIYDAFKVAKNEDNKTDAKEFILGVMDAVNYGKIGAKGYLNRGAFTSTLSEKNQNQFYRIGEIQKEAIAKKNSKAVTKAINQNGVKGEIRGSVTFKDVDQSKLSARQKASVNAISAAFGAIGVNVEFFASPTDDKGNHVGKSGSYNAKTNTISLDIYAGVSGKDTILYTAAHELTHFIAEWSSEKFNVFADFLVENYAKHGQDIDYLIQRKIDASKKSKTYSKPLTYEEAFEEVVCDSCETFLRDSNLMNTLVDLAKQDLTLFEKIKVFIDELLINLEKAYKGLDPETREGKIVSEWKDVIGDLHKMWEDAALSARGNFQSAGGMKMFRSEFSGAKNKDGGELFQYRAMETDEDAYRVLLSEHTDMSGEEINNLFSTIDKAMEIIKGNLEILDYAWEEDIDDRAFNPVKQNSDSLYKFSVDFSTMCRKRILQQVIIEELQTALDRAVTKAESIAIRNELMKLQEEGRQIEIACALCYVESARMKSPAQIQKFLNDRGNVVRRYFASKSKGEVKSQVEKAESETREALARQYASEIANGTMPDPTEKVGKKTKKFVSLKALPDKMAKPIRDAKKAVAEGYKPNANEAKIIKTAETLSVEDFTSAKGLENLAKNHPEIFDAYTSYVRNATKSKGTEKDVWWRIGDSKKLTDDLIAAMNAENGLRTQSWSDFQVMHLLDYVGAIIELSSRNAKMQAYTKVPDYVHLMGLTNQMINLSLIPTATFNGKLDFDSVEGMAFKTALLLRDRYHSTAGTISIGISNDQIRMLLASNLIDYVIPYHQSGMSKVVRKEMHIPTWVSYESYQGEKNLKGDAAKKNAKKYGVTLLSEKDPVWHKAPKFSEWFNADEAKQISEMENHTPSDPNAQKEYGVMYGAYKAMQNAANNYLKLCAERGLSPKFSNEKADFTGEDNYWKLLIDRKMIDNVTGEIIVQKAVKPVFDEAEVLRILNEEVARYPKVKEDMDYATRTVVGKFLSGEMNEDTARIAASILEKPVDNVTKVSILNSAYEVVETNQNNTIDDDGVKNQDRDSNGRRLSEEQVEFFKDSMVRDKRGRLIAALHGTKRGGFTEFAKTDDIGYFFARSMSTASTYADGSKKVFAPSKDSGEFSGAGVYEVYLDIKNPLVIEGAGANWNSLEATGDIAGVRIVSKRWNDREGLATIEVKRGKKTFKKTVTTADEFEGFLREYFGDMAKYLAMGMDGVVDENGKGKMEVTFPWDFDAMKKGEGKTTREIVRRAYDRGHDGVIFKNVVDSGDGSKIKADDLYVVFNSNQAKSTANKNPTKSSDIRYQDRDPDLVAQSTRSLLANALESTIDTSTDSGKNELRKLSEYKAKIGELESIHSELQKVKGEIKNISFTKGKDRSKLVELNSKKVKLENKIAYHDKKLLQLEATKPIKDILAREKAKVEKKHKAETAEVLARARKERNDALAKAHEKFQESRKKNVDSRRRTEMKHKIKRVCADLNKMLNAGKDKANTKEDLRSTAEQALASYALLFESNITNMDIVRNGVSSASNRESTLLNKYTDLMAKRDQYIGNIDAIKAKGGNTADLYKMVDSIDRSIATLNKDLSELFERERKRINEITVDFAIQDLADAYHETQNSSEEYVRNAYSDFIYERIVASKDDLKGATVQDMTLEQLGIVYDDFKMVLHTIRTANTLFKQGKAVFVDQMAGEVIDQVKVVSKGKTIKPSQTADKLRQYGWDELKPRTAFERIGSNSLLDLYDQLRAGEDTFAVDVNEAFTFASEQREKAGYDDFDMLEKHSFDLMTGQTFNLNLAQMLSIYAYSKREQAKKHMLDGGFIFDSKEFFTTSKKGVKKLHEGFEQYRVTPQDLANIIVKIPKPLIDYVDAMQKYLSETMGAKGNETSMEVFGIELFKEDFYFPLVSSKDFVKQSNEPVQAMSLVNAGMTKPTTPNADNPIVLTSFDNVWAGHVNKMSLYHSFVPQLENIRKVYNYYSKDRSAGYSSVKATIKTIFGEGAANYVDKFIDDVNGGMPSNEPGNPLMGLFGKFKKTAVGASLSTVVQQPTAIIRAMADIDPKYFANIEEFKKGAWEELKQYAPIAIIKEIGGFDTGSGRGVVDYLSGNATKNYLEIASEKVDDLSMLLAGKADEFGWNIIWGAVKKEIASTTDLKVGSEEFLQRCGERFTEVVHKTQVYDSVFTRSGFMRSKNDLTKISMSFMAEPTTAINMLYSAVMNAKRGNISKGKAARSCGAVVVSQILASFMASLIYGARDDDEDEAYVEKVMEQFGAQLLDDVTPLFILKSLPYIKDIMTLFEGWDVERNDMSILTDIRDAFDALFSENKSTYRKIEDFAGAIAAAFGLPAKNVMREFRALYNLGRSIFDDITPTWDSVGSAYGQGIVDNGIVGGARDTLDKVRNAFGGGDDDSESANRNELRSKDKRIKEAASSVIGGNYASIEDYTDRIVAEGKYAKEDVVGAINAEVSYFKNKVKKAAEAKIDGDNSAYKDIVRNLRKEYRRYFTQDEIVSMISKKVKDIQSGAAEEKEESSSYYKPYMVNEALNNGDTAQALKIIDDIIEAKVENGDTKKEAKASVKSSVTSYWKPLFLEAYKSKDNAEMTRIRKLLRASKLYDNPIGTTQDWIKSLKKK